LGGPHGFAASSTSVVGRANDMHISKLSKEPAQLVWDKTEDAPAEARVRTLVVSALRRGRWRIEPVEFRVCKL
jgi:hypothetical protein